MKRIIVCGFGFMGQNHAANICQNPDLELAAVVDSRQKSEIKPVKGNVETAVFDWEKLDSVPFYTSLPEALKHCPADAVLIASPTAFHVPSALEAIRHGKHVFVEKPLSFSMAEVEEIQAALQGKNLVFQVGHCLRFRREYQLIGKAVRDNQYGKLKFLKLTRSTGLPDWGVWKNLKVSLVSTAGPIFDLNIHDIDFALSVFGEPDGMTAETGFGTDTLFRTVWKYPNGSAVQIDGGFMRPSSYPFRAGYTAVFEHGVLEYDSRLPDRVTVSTEEGCSVMDTKTEHSIYYDELAEFASSMMSGAPVRCNVFEATRTIRCCCRLKELFEGSVQTAEK